MTCFACIIPGANQSPNRSNIKWMQHLEIQYCSQCSMLFIGPKETQNTQIFLQLHDVRAPKIGTETHGIHIQHDS